MTPRWLVIIFGILLFPALLWNLGVMVFIDDEAIRALVAQEMLWTGDYLVPTMHGDPYLNKPPLWNWILTLSFRLWGGASEWATRFPTVVCLLIYAGVAYRLTRKELGQSVALLGALSIITCGRMLFWDSMLGLIDVCFSGVIFTQFLLLWRYGERGDWWRAFGFTYALTAVAFLLKGFPAIVFQGLTIIGYLVWRGEWRRLFGLAHILSGLGCLALLAAYYLPYSQEVPFREVWGQLFSESSKRTALEHGWADTLEHLALFPLEMSYHFLPWTCLLILFLRRDLRKRLRAIPLLGYLLLVFAVNIPIYWLSPNVYPRYLLMLWPLIFFVGMALYQQQSGERTLHFRGLYILLGVIVTSLSLGTFLIPLVPETDMLWYRWWLAPVLGLAGLAVSYRYWRRPIEGPMLVCVFLLLVRITLNGYVLPPRAAEDEKGMAVRESATRVGQDESLRPLAIYGWSTMEPAVGYYLEMAYGGLVPRHVFELDSSAYYIVSPRQYPSAQAILETDSIYARHDNRPWYKVTDLRKYELEPPASGTDEYRMTIPR